MAVVAVDELQSTAWLVCVELEICIEIVSVSMDDGMLKLVNSYDTVEDYLDTLVQNVVVVVCALSHKCHRRRLFSSAACRVVCSAVSKSRVSLARGPIGTFVQLCVCFRFPAICWLSPSSRRADRNGEVGARLRTANRVALSYEWRGLFLLP